MKPHHFIDLLCSFGKGQIEFEPDPYGNALNAISKKIWTNRDVAFIFTRGPDGICAPCKRNIKGICADGVEYTPIADRQIKTFTDLGYDKLPLCMAKTHLSLSHDPKLKGAPTGFNVPIREVRASVGAGFLYPLLGQMSTMPGLPTVPAGAHVDIDDDGKTMGLF